MSLLLLLSILSMNAHDAMPLLGGYKNRSNPSPESRFTMSIQLSIQEAMENRSHRGNAMHLLLINLFFPLRIMLLYSLDITNVHSSIVNIVKEVKDDYGICISGVNICCL